MLPRRAAHRLVGRHEVGETMSTLTARSKQNNQNKQCARIEKFETIFQNKHRQTCAAGAMTAFCKRANCHADRKDDDNNDKRRQQQTTTT